VRELLFRIYSGLTRKPPSWRFRHVHLSRKMTKLSS
jgi:hypothetical protein